MDKQISADHVADDRLGIRLRVIEAAGQQRRVDGVENRGSNQKTPLLLIQAGKNFFRKIGQPPALQCVLKSVFDKGQALFLRNPAKRLPNENETAGPSIRNPSNPFLLG